MTTTVGHIKIDSGGVYVGRRRGSAEHFGNPFTFKAGTAATVVLRSSQDCIEAFREWLDGSSHQDVEPERRLWILKNLHTLRGKALRCYCRAEATPKCFENRCHADVLADMAEGLI